MSASERILGERFIEAMGPMVQDENKVQQVFFFIQSMRESKDDYPAMSYEELEQCIPMDVAFKRLKEDVRLAYGK